MGREIRLVLVAALIVALLGATTLALQRHPAEKPNKTATFKNVEPVAVTHVLIHNAYGTTEIAFTGEGYVVDDIPAEVVDMADLIALLTACGRVEALRIVDTAPRDLALYGLERPTAQIASTYEDATSLTLEVGADERVTGNYYVRVAGDPAVYLMGARQIDSFLQPKRALVEDQVTPPLALSSPLSALWNVTLEGGQLAAPVTIEAVAAGDPAVVRAALSFGTPTHIVRGKGVYELDQTYGVEMLGPLLGITATDIAGYGLTAAEISAFGFDRPAMRITFDLKNGPEATLTRYELAVLAKGDRYYMTCNDNGVIYAVARPTILDLSYDRLPVRWFLSPLLTDVRGLELVTSGQTLSCTIAGRVNKDKQATCNGQAIDMERFRALYKLLVSAAHDGALLDSPKLVGEPLLRLTYDYQDERKQPDVMALYPGDARRVYVQVNGVSELAMREAYLTRVQQALAALWSDEPIVTDW